MPILTGITNYFTKVFENTVAMTLGGSISPGATTVPVSGMTNYTDGDIVCFTIEPTDPVKKQVFTGTKNGTNVVNVSWTYGTNVPHTNGVSIIDYVSATDWDLMQKGILVQHNQNGTHAAITATSLVTTGAITEGTIPLASVRAETLANFIASGGVITVTSGLGWSMTGGVVYIGGKRLTFVGATGNASASSDTYFDLKDNNDGTAALVNTGGNIVANAAASPALAASSVRVAKVVTNGTTITSVVQTGTDSLLNLYRSLSPLNILGNIFGNSVTTSTNTGAGTGSYSFLNLGGMKLLWGSLTVTAAASGGALNFSVSFPGSFFTSAPTPVGLLVNNPVTSGNWQLYAASTSTSSSAITAVNNSGSTASIGPSYLFIGT